jgi:hypothetical protein
MFYDVLQIAWHARRQTVGASEFDETQKLSILREFCDIYSESNVFKRTVVGRRAS